MLKLELCTFTVDNFADIPCVAKDADPIAFIFVLKMEHVELYIEIVLLVKEGLSKLATITQSALMMFEFSNVLVIEITQQMMLCISTYFTLCIKLTLPSVISSS